MKHHLHVNPFECQKRTPVLPQKQWRFSPKAACVSQSADAKLRNVKAPEKELSLLGTATGRKEIPTKHLWRKGTGLPFYPRFCGFGPRVEAACCCRQKNIRCLVWSRVEDPSLVRLLLQWPKGVGGWCQHGCTISRFPSRTRIRHGASLLLHESCHRLPIRFWPQRVTVTEIRLAISGSEVMPFAVHAGKADPAAGNGSPVSHLSKRAPPGK